MMKALRFLFAKTLGSMLDDVYLEVNVTSTILKLCFLQSSLHHYVFLYPANKSAACKKCENLASASINLIDVDQ